MAERKSTNTGFLAAMRYSNSRRLRTMLRTSSWGRGRGRIRGRRTQGRAPGTATHSVKYSARLQVLQLPNHALHDVLHPVGHGGRRGARGRGKKKVWFPHRASLSLPALADREAMSGEEPEDAEVKSMQEIRKAAQDATRMMENLEAELQEAGTTLQAGAEASRVWEGVANGTAPAAGREGKE